MYRIRLNYVLFNESICSSNQNSLSDIQLNLNFDFISNVYSVCCLVVYLWDSTDVLFKSLRDVFTGNTVMLLMQRIYISLRDVGVVYTFVSLCFIYLRFDVQVFMTSMRMRMVWSAFWNMCVDAYGIIRVIFITPRIYYLFCVNGVCWGNRYFKNGEFGFNILLGLLWEAIMAKFEAIIG